MSPMSFWVRCGMTTPRPPMIPSFGMYAAPAFLAILVILIGLFPKTIVGPLVAVTAAAVIGGDGELPYYSPEALARVHARALHVDRRRCRGRLGVTRIWRS